MTLLRSVRLKLLALALLPLVVLLPILLGITVVRWMGQFDDLLLSKVESDLRIAQGYFERIRDRQSAAVSSVAGSAAMTVARRTGPAFEAEYLLSRRDELDLDFLISTTVDDERFASFAIGASEVIEPPQTSAGLIVWEREQMDAISPRLSGVSRLLLVETDAARTIDRETEDRGMFMIAVHRDLASGTMLIGGRLLNRNLAFIDRINGLIYDETEGTTNSGTTTLFLDDVRISTNVRLFEGDRALGTRVSEEVWQHVMVNGQQWLDRAFVVNDWYISGYMPLADIHGNRIGMIYTGFLEEPFAADRTATGITLALSLIAILLISVPVFLKMAAGIFAPLERMSATMALAQKGDLAARIGKVRASNEIADVAQHLDRMLDQVQERDERLNELVEERTAELKSANEELEATFAQLVMSEKLASVGEITAGVAHEINNPVAVIQGNLEVVRFGLGELAQDFKVEFDLIDAQTHRINTIVNKLLKFTRSDELSDVAEPVSPELAIRDALVLVAADLRTTGVETKMEVDPTTPAISIIATELQQVLVNLIINAVHVMPNGGTLTLETYPQTRDGTVGAAISITDTGPGLPEGKQDSVFNPFFTTKLGEGTGLGLSISQALVSKVGGSITAHNTLDQGAQFIVWCPAVDSNADNMAKHSEKVDILSAG
ncbi:MAG: cache domain-containing protein [Pseudomonadota bacterium]